MIARKSRIGEDRCGFFVVCVLAVVAVGRGLPGYVI